MQKPVAAVVSLLPARSRLRWTRKEARAVVEAYEESGLSLDRFAAREGLKPERLFRWTRKLSVGKAPAATKFVELRPTTSSHRMNRIEIVLRSGHVLFVEESFDPTALDRVLKLLERDAGC
jgi:transposase-like protein